VRHLHRIFAAGGLFPSLEFIGRCEDLQGFCASQRKGNKRLAIPSTAVIDAETGQRGYIITGKSEFLDPYIKANDEFKKVINDLREKLKDKPQHLQALEEIEHLKLKWEGEAGDPEIRLRKLVGESKTSLKQIDDLILEGTGKNILDEMRGILESLEKELRESNKIKELVFTIELGRAIVDSETGQRGFMLAGQDSFLEPKLLRGILFRNSFRKMCLAFKIYDVISLVNSSPKYGLGLG